MGVVAKRWLFIVAATVLTWAANNRAALNAEVASAGIGLLIAFADLGLAAPVYAASFAGMASASVIPHTGWAALMGIFVRCLYSIVSSIVS